MDAAYGKRDPATGQWEFHAVVTSGHYRRPLRHSYRHLPCGAETGMGRLTAETFARQPAFYTHTCCAFCKDYYPVAEFLWPDGKPVGS